MVTLSRRQILKLGAATLAAPSPFVAGAVQGAAASPAPLRELTLWGPPAGPSIIATTAIARGMLRPVADKITFKVWRSPDELRAGLTSQAMQVAIVPTQVAANLYSRGLGLRLLNVLTKGLIYVVSKDPSLTTLESLKGRRVLVPFPNDTPDLLFRSLLAEAKLDAKSDVMLETTGTPVQALQLFLADRADAAVLPEPGATAAILRAKAAGQTVTRVMNFQDIWHKVTGLSPVLPQAGLAIADGFRKTHAGLLDPLNAGFVEATDTVVADPAKAASIAASALVMPWPVLEKSVAHSNFACIRARDARFDLETMFSVLERMDAAVVGGRIPDGAFYL